MPDTTNLAEIDAFQRLVPIIQSGNCVLFLGAGVSMDSGAPSGKQAAKELSAALFPNEPVSEDLGGTCEAVDAVYGRKDLNDWLVERFRTLTPQGALHSIPTYCWKSIYTVNFDTLLEEAYRQCSDRRQDIRPFYSDKDPLSRLRPGEVPLYKLHGCLSRANSREGRLVLTPDDFAAVGESRQRFLNRLLEDVSDYTILYVGFGRADSDFRRILLDVERAAHNLTDLRRSYALQPHFLESQKTFWEQKRVTLIDAKAGPFFQALDQALPKWGRYAEPDIAPKELERSITQRYAKLTTAVLSDLERNFEVIDERIKDQAPNIDEFFLGAQPNWGLLVSHADAKRDIEDDVVTSVIHDQNLDLGDVQFVLIHAEAGSGKTTLLRRIGVDLALTWDQVVVSLKAFGSLDFLSLERFTTAVGRRVCVVVDDATSVARELGDLLLAAKRSRMKLTVLATARTNEWKEVSSEYEFGHIEEFELRSLSRVEIDGIIKTLTDHNALGYLAGASKEAKVAAFETRANKQLLVALREATVGKNFDAIIADEFDRIPTIEGQRAYLLVASLHRFGILTRAGLLHRALNLPLKEIGHKVLEPTEKVIIAQEPLGGHDVYYTTRHPLIANIVFDRKLLQDRRRLEFYQDLVSNLDLGYSSDLDAYRRLTRGKNRQLLRDFKSPDDRRDLMRQLLRRDPNDAYAFQHAAIMELDQNNLLGAAPYIEQAIAIAPQDPSIRDTEGRFVRMSAVEEQNPFLAEEKFARAEQIYKRNAKLRPDEPFAYRNLAETYLAWSRKKDSDEDRMKYVGLAYDALNEGLANCTSVAMLLQKQAEIEQDVLEDADKAREIFATILQQRPSDITSRFLAATLEEKEGRPERALELLKAGLDDSPYDPRLHFRVAHLMAENNAGSQTDIRSHFDAAMLGSLRDIRPRIAYGAFLFSIGDHSASQARFAELDKVVTTKREANELSRFNYGTLRGNFEGRVENLTYSAGWVEFGQGATSVFFNPRATKKQIRDKLYVGVMIRFRIAFNQRGPVAIDVTLADGKSAPEVFRNMTLNLLVGTS
jgi:tetratricopeptide (TPR) repeat protein